MKHFNKIFILLLFVASNTGVSAQSFNNEWIDYSKTYYKFKVGSSGLYRINQPVLAAAGLANVPVQQFQLWRNGIQVPIFISVSAGSLPASGYIEFWGERNDGKPDKALYKNAAHHQNDELSLQTDTAAYFLTVNPSLNNWHILDDVNDVAANTLPAEPYFIHKERVNFRDQVHRGKAVYFGEYVWSSTYDMGEFLSSRDINPASPLDHSFTDLYAASSGPSAKLTALIAGSSIFGGTRTTHLSLNSTNLVSQPLPNFNTNVLTGSNINLSTLQAGSANVRVAVTNSNSGQGQNDRIVVGYIELQYARRFNFGGKTNFKFELPASGEKYLEITNFDFGGSTPILYDLTNQKRYTAEMAGTVLQFALPPSGQPRSFVLVSQADENINTIESIQPKNFINFTNTANQASFLFITNKIISNGGSALQDYMNYRSSATGGSFSTSSYDIDELVDQFAFGIKKHPLSIKNFLRWARVNFTATKKPQFAVLVGKAVSYSEYRMNENNPNAERLNLVPAFGWPASDVLLASDNFVPIATTAIGRLSVINNQELADYLEKLKTYEQQQSNSSQTIDEKAWMKNVVHVAGGNSPSLDATLDAYFNGYENTIRDSLFGANIIRFSKSTTGPVTPITDALMEKTLENGTSIINYFGHSSSTALDYALNNPASYNNAGKYPVFVVNGCLAGDIFSMDPSRLNAPPTLSEIWQQAKNKGSIAFIASSHFGVTNYLDVLNTGLYRSISGSGYGKPISQNIKDASQFLMASGFDSTSRYLHAEENILNGDPSIKINSSPLPDYVVEQSKVQLSPTIVSVADGSFTVKAFIYNIGKAAGKAIPVALQDSVIVTIKRQYPGGTQEVVLQKALKPAIRFLDSVQISLPILPLRDKGENRIIVTVDPDGRYAEMSESNNTAERVFVIIEDELRPLYPYNYSIVSQQSTKFYASTANAMGELLNYSMEIDTSASFNSPLKKAYSVSSIGGAIEFDPINITWLDSTVYYWRTAIIKDNNPSWTTYSFTYINSSTEGFGQKHFGQYSNNVLEQLILDNDQVFRYPTTNSPVTIQHGNYPPNDHTSSFVDIKNNRVANWGNYGWPYGTLQFIAINGKTLEPLANGVNVGKWGSTPGETRWRQFEYHFTSQAGRDLASAFIDSVPDGYFIIVYPMIHNDPAPFYDVPFAEAWKWDPGTNNLYNKLKQHGISQLDSFNRKRPFIFIFKKNDNSFAPIQVFGEKEDVINASFNAIAHLADGQMATPLFGPASAWHNLQWKGKSVDPVLQDREAVQVFGVTANGQEQLLTTVVNANDTSLSFVNANVYPYIKLKMFNRDTVYATPSQLRYWFVKGSYLPEGALAPNLHAKMKDTFEIGEPVQVAIPFKNVSSKPFADSLKVRFVLTDNNNVAKTIEVPRLKPLQGGDTAVLRYNIETMNLTGNNTLHVFVNPGFDQPEFTLYNNLLYKNFYVDNDQYRPVMDVTFDGVHILNNDLVAARPNIVIKVKDESRYLLLDDTANVTVQLVRKPLSGGPSIIRRFAYGTDTLRFIGATPGAPENEARIEFNPFLPEDGDYELWVKAKDKMSNSVSAVEYRVAFKVINKAMISNMFNYPNPFTSSTAFVFTLTGAEVPQNIRIQILTVTGKIVKEITKQELGPLHIGRNITEYKWDGTDQYGQKLGNGVYLYRVITNHNGNSLEKYHTMDVNGNKVDTDSYFKGGYGKMYLMR